MKKIVTIAAVAAFATLSACTQTETVDVPVDETAAATEAATDNATEEAPGKGGPCGDGTVLRENEQCR